MVYQVLAIGYLPEEQNALSQEWGACGIDPALSSSEEHAQQLLDKRKSYVYYSILAYRLFTIH